MRMADYKDPTKKDRSLPNRQSTGVLVVPFYVNTLLEPQCDPAAIAGVSPTFWLDSIYLTELAFARPILKSHQELVHHPCVISGVAPRNDYPR